MRTLVSSGLHQLEQRMYTSDNEQMKTPKKIIKSSPTSNGVPHSWWVSLLIAAMNLDGYIVGTTIYYQQPHIITDKQHHQAYECG